MSAPSAQTTSLEQIIEQREAARGAAAWTGAEGAADAFALMGQHWNVDVYTTLTSLYTSGYNLERLG